MRNEFPRANTPRRGDRITFAELQAQIMNSPFWTDHGHVRAIQRNLNKVDVVYILQHGCEIHRTGVIFHYLRTKDIPPQHRHLREIMRLAGAVVITSSEDVVITLYTHGRKQRLIHRKMKYRFTPGERVICADVEEAGEE